MALCFHSPPQHIPARLTESGTPNKRPTSEEMGRLLVGELNRSILPLTLRCMGWNLGAKVSAAIGAAVLLSAGGLVGVEAYKGYESSETRARSCSLVQETERLYAKQRQDKAGMDPDIAVLGDSYTQGLHISSPLSAFPYALAEELKLETTVHGVGGSGYVAGGPCTGQHLATRLEAALASQPDLLIVQAGINDRGKPGVENAAVQLFADAKRMSPATRIVAVGPFSPPAAAGAEMDQVAAAIERAATAAGVSFIDARGWSFPTVADKLHPTESGHAMIAKKISAALPPL